MAQPTTYLDWAATAPAHPAAVAAVTQALAAHANPSSVHRGGRAARRVVEEARERILGALRAPAEARLVFTSGGTEALGLALRGDRLSRQIVSAVEHDAVRMQAGDAGLLPVDEHGRVRLEELEAMLRDGPPTLVAVMHANNETGVVQPVAEVAAIVRSFGGRLLVDAMQTAGKLPLPEADYVTVSAHKLGGPAGIGALLVRDPATLVPVQRGGSQEGGLRAGTENVAGIAGFAAAVEALAADAGWLQRTAVMQIELETTLAALGAEVIGAGVERLPTISCVRLPGVPAATQLMALDLAGICVGAGAACSSGTMRPSHVLRAMGLGEREAGEAVRVSTGWSTTSADIDRFLDAYAALARRRAA